MIGISTDVTESRKLQARAIQNDRIAAMGTLAASVAHEINNPLTYVLGSLGAGRRRALAARPATRDGGQRRERWRGGARTAPSGWASITRELRTFAGPRRRGRRRSSRGAVVGAVLQLVRKEIEARARLTVELAETPRCGATSRGWCRWC